MVTQESIQFSNISASTSPFVVKGGRYMASVVATFGGGSVKLQMLGFDGTTYLDIKQTFEKADGTGGTAVDDVIGTFSANGAKLIDLAPGQYRLTVATASAIYAAITRVPLE